ncbi:hypothetical protein SAMN04488504_11073 [Myxococcus virescens]|uniref:Uncharacterized protein n=1 Tax=Myxococcus virescens TaxID=83456 RepID=A0ABY0MXZ4_9BACT|nr:hypothetical protein SAMN04488504_11073 [Myxococcus virescens]
MRFTVNVDGQEHAVDAPSSTSRATNGGFTGPGTAAAWSSAAHVRC